MLSSSLLAASAVSTAAPPFLPSDLGPSVIKLWLDPTDPGITLGGSNDIAAWPDKSGNANDGGPAATGGQRLILTAGALNSLPMARAALPSQYMPSAGETNIVAPGVARTIFMVVANGAASQANGRIITFAASSNQFIANLFDFGGGTSIYTDVSTNLENIPTVSYTTPKIVMVTWDGVATNTVLCKIGNVTATVTFSVGTHTTAETGTAGWSLGHPSGAGWIGDYGDQIVCAGVLSGADQTAVYGYLATKWGL